MPDTLLLPGGRTLGYAVTGDPAGPPVFYFHGWPASRLEAALIEDLPVRLIAMDRPGYGLSTPQRRRRLVDWPADVAAVADHLGLDRFHLVGVSGGAPYAMACLAPSAAGRARVAGVALISPLPPSQGPGAPDAAALGDGLQRLFRLGRHPMLGRAVMGGTRLAVRAGLFDPHKVLDGATSERDRACLTPALRDGIVAAWREGLRHGVAGALSDARIYAAPWGFDLSAITAPVAVWHGTDDIVVPPETVAAYRALPNADVTMLDGEGHYSLALTRTDEVLAALLPR